jgi:S-adenosylmethionine hydrolase
MARPIITLLTDFGPSSPYVAQMKGVILSINPDATLVDITHAVAPQDVRQGALVLDQVCERFPAGTIHAAVVDPGVGSERAILAVELGGMQFVLPDNGLVSRLALRTAPSTIRRLTEPAYWLPAVSATFHGRDIIAPVAARLSLGLSLERLGPPQASWVQLPWPEVRVSSRKIEGVIESIDSFGNLVSNIDVQSLADAPRDERTSVTCDEHQTQGIFNTYSDQPAMTLIALVGSSGRLELAIVGESAAAMLGVRVGTPVVVTWE